LQIADYLALEKPSEKVPTILFASVAPGLFGRVVNRCTAPGTPCVSDVMAHDLDSGGAMPAGRDTAPPRGGQAKGALVKKPGEIAPGLNVTQTRGPGAPGSIQPAPPRNRAMSSLLPPITPGLPGAGRS
jgi:cytochrome o ubiquinol oxidase subunit 2